MSKIKLAAFFVMFQTSSFSMQTRQTNDNPIITLLTDRHQKNMHKLKAMQKNANKSWFTETRKFYSCFDKELKKFLKNLQKEKKNHEQDIIIARLNFENRFIEELLKRSTNIRFSMDEFNKVMQNIGCYQEIPQPGSGLVEKFKKKAHALNQKNKMRSKKPLELSVILEKTIEESTMFYNY